MFRAEDISVTIRKRQLLKNIDFTCKKGEVTALIGPNGAGKTTLLKAISGDIPFEGKVTLHESNITDYSAKDLAKIKAVLLQKSNLQFDFKVNEVTMMGRYPYFSHTPSQNDHKIANYYTNYLSLSDHVEQVHISLSGGEQQRNHFARVLAQLDSNSLLPKLLLLDEPLNNLDIKYQYQFMEMIKEFADKGNSVIVVMHDLNMTAEFANQVVLLKNGKLQALGTPEEVYTTQILEGCYEIPVHIQPHPFKNHPMVLFNLQNNNLDNVSEEIYQLVK